MIPPGGGGQGGCFLLLRGGFDGLAQPCPALYTKNKKKRITFPYNMRIYIRISVRVMNAEYLQHDDENMSEA